MYYNATVPCTHSKPGSGGLRQKPIQASGGTEWPVTPSHTNPVLQGGQDSFASVFSARSSCKNWAGEESAKKKKEMWGGEIQRRYSWLVSYCHHPMLRMIEGRRTEAGTKRWNKTGLTDIKKNGCVCWRRHDITESKSVKGQCMLLLNLSVKTKMVGSVMNFVNSEMEFEVSK